MSKHFSHSIAFFALYAPLLIWMLVIFSLSAVPGNGAVYEMPRLMLLERKGAHVAEYCILTFLLVRIFMTHLPKNRTRAFALSAFCAILYAVSDETHQLFVFGRTGKATDVFIDSLGVVLAISAVWYGIRCMELFKKEALEKTSAKRLPRKRKKPTMKV